MLGGKNTQTPSKQKKIEGGQVETCRYAITSPSSRRLRRDQSGDAPIHEEEDDDADENKPLWWLVALGNTKGGRWVPDEEEERDRERGLEGNAEAETAEDATVVWEVLEEAVMGAD